MQRRTRRHNLLSPFALVAIWVSLDVPAAPRLDASPDTQTAASATPLFETNVAPILRTYCWSCHGSGGRASGLDLRTLPLILRGGENGAVIVPGAAEKSVLYQKITAGEMPPDKATQSNVIYSPVKPTPAHRETIRAWIDAGAPAQYRARPLSQRESPPLSAEDHSWWAFQEPRRPDVPNVAAAERARTPVDAFVLRRLEEQGLNLSPEADKETLMRRLYYDLVGLPPPLDELDAFLTDTSSEAYVLVVDRLLASPHYGERWGRHWLDAAGYVDTIGADNDSFMIPRDGIWRYRDYVIDAYNADLPYDRFLLEQLAGTDIVDWQQSDLRTAEVNRHLVATGFLRQAADDTGSPELNTADIRTQVLFDTVQLVSTNVLGLTLHCAQCHTHKFDPISHADYYRFAALFMPAYDPQNWQHAKERFLFDVADAERATIDADNKRLDEAIAQAKESIESIRRPVRAELLGSKLAEVPEQLRDDTREALATDAKKRSAVQKYLVEKFGPRLAVTAKEIDARLESRVRAEIDALQIRAGDLEARKQTYGRIQALWDVGNPDAYLYRRGVFETPGPAVDPGVPTVLNTHARFVPPSNEAAGNTTGRRQALARWLAHPRHPLTARVFVNRVWQHLFGRGLVATTSNFGRSGAQPTHPQLLDWLATEFIRGGWSLKRLHRTIVTSSVYRQTSRRRRAEGTPPIAQRSAVAPATPKTRDFNALSTAGTRRGGQGEVSSSEVNLSKVDPQRVDPENRLLWRMPLRRLESEAVRDAVLTVAGMLAPKLGGPPIPLDPKPDGSVLIDTKSLASPQDAHRRSVYIFARRNYHLTELNVFDQPLVAHNCTRRVPSAVVLQSLTMLNGEFTMTQAERFAARAAAFAGSDPDRRIATCFRLALSRSPTAEERRLSRQLIRQHLIQFEANNVPVEERSLRALTNLCHMLLNASEFLYVQ